MKRCENTIMDDFSGTKAAADRLHDELTTLVEQLKTPGLKGRRRRHLLREIREKEIAIDALVSKMESHLTSIQDSIEKARQFLPPLEQATASLKVLDGTLMGVGVRLLWAERNDASREGSRLF